jgi:hypothetical protein
LSTDDASGGDNQGGGDAATDGSTVDAPTTPGDGDVSTNDAATDGDAGEPFAADLVMYLPLDDGMGTLARDATGHDHNGILKNNPTWVAGKSGMALSFDGNQQYMELLTLDGAGFPASGTFSVWFKSEFPDMTNRALLDSWDDKRSHIYVRQVASAPRLVEVTSQRADASAYVFETYTAATASKWTRLVVTWDTTTHVQTVYFDGVLLATDMLPADWTPKDAKPLVAAPGCCGGWKGELDEIRLYGRALSKSEVAMLP